MKTTLCTQCIVFCLCFLCMAARHWTLEAWAMTKELTSQSLHFSGTALGALDTTYLCSYALGCYASGHLGDRFSRVKIAVVGLTITCVAITVAIVAGFSHFASLPLFIVLWVCNGGGQSTVWPSTVAIMGNWFSKENRGSIFGFWSVNSSAGNIIGSQFAGLMISRHASWEAIMLLAVVGLFLSLALFALFVSERPEPCLISTEDTSMLPTTNADSTVADESTITFFRVWKLQGVAVYAAAYACLKLMNYGVMFWMPFYLGSGLEMEGSIIGILASLFDLGGALGGIAVGHISDRLQTRTAILAPLVLLSLPLLVLFLLISAETSYFFFAIVPLLGLAIISPTNLVSSTVASDLAHTSEIEGNRKILGTVAGIIDGTGSFGAALGMLVIGWLQDYSWTYVFLFLIANGLVATILLFMEMHRSYTDFDLKPKSPPSSLGLELEVTDCP